MTQDVSSDGAAEPRASEADSGAATPRLGQHLHVVASNGEPDYAAYAAALIESRKTLARCMSGSIFGDPALDMLLDLFVAAERDERRYVTSCCHAAGTPHTTTVRYVNVMVQAGLIARQDDEEDARRTLLEITPKARWAIQTWLETISSTQLPRKPREHPGGATPEHAGHGWLQYPGQARQES